MRILVLLFILSVFNSCTSKQSKQHRQTPKSGQDTVIPINYDSCKKAVLLTKQRQKNLWAHIPKTEKERIFTTAVAETIIPDWIGTAWDFNGTTEKPQLGSIACGYFVTTVLRDAGLDLARTRLAQCASEQMIISLIQPKYIRRFSNVTIEDFIQSIHDQGYGLFIVGLDNHTGFIYNDGNDIYFIHSTFVGSKNVQKEKAATSRILEQSKYKVLGKISADEKVLERWIN